MENLLALALACLILMSTSWFQHVLERRIITNLENLTGGRVEIGHFRFKPWLFQVNLEKLVVHGSEPAGEPPLLSVRAVEASVSPGHLLRGRLRLRHLDMDGLQAHIRTGASGATNLPRPRVQTTAGQELADLMALSIGRLTVSHSAFFWNNQRQPLDLEAREMAILLRKTKGHYGGAISSSPITLRFPGVELPPVTFNGRFDLSPKRLEFSTLAWQAQGTSGEASFTVLFQPASQASGAFRASADIPTLARILHAPEWRTGTLQIVGHATYQNGRVTAQGHAQAHQVAIFKPALPPVIFDAASGYTLERNQLNLPDLQVALWGGTVHGTLQANFRDRRTDFRLNARVHGVRLENVLRGPRTAPLFATQLHPATAAEGTLGATWSGLGEGLKADFDLAFQPPAEARPNVLPISGAARGTLEGGRGLTLRLAQAEFQTPHSTLTARGTLAQKAASPAAAEALTVALTTDDFEEWRPFFQALVAAPSGIPLELQSPAGFSGQLCGSIEAPSLKGRLKMGRFRYEGWAWDRLNAAIALNPQFVQISEGRVEHEKSYFEMDASAQLDDWRLTPQSMVRFSARARHTPIEGLKAAINPNLPLRGFLSGDLDVEGTATTLAGSGRVRIDAGAWADETFDSFSTQLRVAKSIWKLPDLRLNKKTGRLSGELTIEPARRWASGHLVGTDFRLADIHHLSATDSLAPPQERLDGKLNFEARGQGTPNDFHLQSSWRLSELSVAGTSLGEFHGTLTGNGNELRLEGEDQSPGGNLRVTARATAQGDWPMEAEGEYSRLRADPWIRDFFNREFAAAATLSGSFRAEGPLRTPAKINLRAHVAEVAVDFPSVQWRNAQPVDVRLSEGRLTLNRFVMRGPATELEIAGAVGFNHDVPLDLSAEGTANATLLTVFDSKLHAAGRSTVHLRLAGTLARPLLHGTMGIQDVSLDYQGLPFRFSGLQGEIRLEGERASITSLRGNCGGGTVVLSGFVTLVDNPRFEVRTDLSQVRVRYPTFFTSVLDGNLRLAGGVENSQLQGDLVIRQMVVNENVNFIEKVMEVSGPLEEAPANVTSPAAAKIRLNVRVTSSPPVQLQTRNIRLTADVDVRLQGTLASPVQVGTVHFIRGETVLRGNRYTLVRGDLNMTNPFRTQAYLDLEAETRVQSYDLTIDITGPMDRLKSSYRSDPPLPTSDILSLLALGYVRQEGAFSPVGTNATASIGASALLSEALSSQVTGRIQRLFGVSRIKIDPNVGVPGFASGARVTVEQQVAHDLTLTYVTNTSYSQYRIIQFEWNISDNVSLLAVRDQNGVFGMEFRFRHRFK